MNTKGKTENLTPFKKGVSGNPGGRPKKRPVTDEYFQESEAPVPEKIRLKINEQLGEERLPKGATWARANAVRRFFVAVVAKDGTKDSKEIREAIEGKAPQRLEISGPERKEITIAVRFVKRQSSKGSSTE